MIEILTKENEMTDKTDRELMQQEIKAVLAQPDPPIAQAVIQAMQDDPEYAWCWHCCIAMAFVDAGGDRYTANQGAARFLEMFAKVQPAHELPAPEQERREWQGLTDEEIQTTWDSVMDGAVSTRREVYKTIEAKLKEKNT
jgi:hypothetical protein